MKIIIVRVTKITELKTLPTLDIEIAHVNGITTVVKKGLFKENGLAVLKKSDSVALFPLSIIPETYDEGVLLSNEDLYQEGEDITDRFI